MQFLHILSFKLRTLSKVISEPSIVNLTRHGATLVVFGGFAVGVYFCAAITTSYVLNTAHLGLFLLHRFLAMLLFVFFLSINVGNIVVSYATFYRSAEMNYLLTKPISHLQVFIIKFLDNFFYSSTAFLLIGVAVLLGYGSYFHLPWYSYIQVSLFMLFPFMLTAGSLSVMMLLLLMSFAHVIGVRTIVGFLIGIYLFVLYGYFSLTNPLRLVSSVMSYFPNVDQNFANLEPGFVHYLPNQWIAESLYWTARGDQAYALSYTILLVLTSAAVFGLMLLMARKLFYRSWIASLQLRTMGESRLPIRNLYSLTRPSRIDPQWSVLIRKEIWQFVREPSQWIHLATVAMLITTFVVSILQIDLRQSLPLYQALSYLVILLFNGFLVASIALRFVFPIVSIEGVNFWAVLSAPLNRSNVFWLKLLLPLVPTLVLSEILVVVAHHSFLRYPGLLVAASLLMFSMTAALIALNYGAAWFFTDFREKNPIRIASSQSATLTFLASVVYLTVIVAVLFLPLHGYFSYLLRAIPYDTLWFWLAVGGLCTFSWIAALLSLTVGSKALQRDF